MKKRLHCQFSCMNHHGRRACQTIIYWKIVECLFLPVTIFFFCHAFLRNCKPPCKWKIHVYFNSLFTYFILDKLPSLLCCLTGGSGSLQKRKTAISDIPVLQGHFLEFYTNETQTHCFTTDLISHHTFANNTKNNIINQYTMGLRLHCFLLAVHNRIM